MLGRLSVTGLYLTVDGLDAPVMVAVVSSRFLTRHERTGVMDLGRRIRKAAGRPTVEDFLSNWEEQAWEHDDMDSLARLKMLRDEHPSPTAEQVRHWLAQHEAQITSEMAQFKKLIDAVDAKDPSGEE